MYLVWLLSFLLGVLPASAQENIAQSSTEIETAPIIENMQDDFYDPDEELGRAKLIERPECSSPLLLEKVLNLAEKQFYQGPTPSTIGQREKVLLMKNIKSFEEISAKGFPPEEDFNVANALITLKINRKIATEDITLCRQVGRGNLYLIYYPYQDNYKVHIVNLSSPDKQNEGITFIYP